MPFVPSKQHSKTKKTTVTVDDESFAVWYRPSKVSPATFEALNDNDDSEENINRLVGLVTTFVADWEIAEPVMNGHTDDAGNVLQARDADGNPVWEKWPVDRQHTSQLSFGVLNAIITAISDDLKPGEATAGASVAG